MTLRLWKCGRYLAWGAAACLLAGCAAGGGQRVMHAASDCPPGFLLLCEATHSGGSKRLSKCHCASRAHISKALHDQW